MQIGKFSFRNSAITAVLGVIAIVILSTLANKGRISNWTVYASIVVICGIFGFMIYTEVRTKFVDTNISRYKHITVKQASELFVTSLEETQGCKVKDILPRGIWRPNGKEQVVEFLIILNDGGRFTATVPLDEGEDAIRGLDCVQYPDQYPAYSKRKLRQFSRGGKDVLIESGLKLAPVEERPKVISQIIKKEEKEREGDNEED